MLFNFDFRNRHEERRNTIDPAMRAAIDEAVAAGRVTRIPMGQSGIPHMAWDGYRLKNNDGRPMYLIERDARDRRIAKEARQA